MKRYIWVILLILPFILTGCFNFENVELKSIKDVTYQEFKNQVLKLNVTVTVNNPNKFKVKVKNANMDLLFEQQVIGRVTQIEHVELLGNTQKDYQLQVAIELNNVISNLPVLFRILMNEPTKLYLSGSIQFRSFLYSKTFTIDKLSLK